MRNVINEKKKELNSSNIISFYDDVCKIVNYLSPSIGTEEALNLIKQRDKQGDGLVSNDSLIIHVISKKIIKNFAVYCTLNNPILWESTLTGTLAKINKVVILMVTPELKGGELLNLENFIENDKIDTVEKLVMR